MNFYMETLGCKVNAFESDATANTLMQHGYTKVDTVDKADIILVYSCAVTNVAEAKTRKILRALRRNAPSALLVCVGCYTQVTDNKIRENLPVDLWIGSNYKKDILHIIEQWFDQDRHDPTIYIDQDPTSSFQNLGAGTTTHTRANLKIQDGCNQFCTYCVIPYTRGRESCLSVKEVFKQADILCQDHAEIILTGIHTGRYHDGSYDLATLLDGLASEYPNVRFRISSIEITEISDRLLDVMAKHDNVAHHLHIPLQAGSDATLSRMHRPYTTDQFLNGLNHIRSRFSDIAISTDYIAGFVGETNDEFKQSLEFIKSCKFSFLHVFPYSRKKGTLADQMEGHLDETIKKERTQRLLQLSDQLHQQWLNHFIDKTVDVIIESYGLGHSHGYTSEYAYTTIQGSYPIGTLVKARVTNLEKDHLYAIVE